LYLLRCCIYVDVVVYVVVEWLRYVPVDCCDFVVVNLLLITLLLLIVPVVVVVPGVAIDLLTLCCPLLFCSPGTLYDVVTRYLYRCCTLFGG